MSQHQTTVTERHRMIDLKQQGYTIQAVATEMGWSFACVRKWWRRYRDGGRAALDPPDRRGERGGRMSTFCDEVRQAFQTIKEAHPGWGAPVARLHVALELEVAEATLPSLSTIEKYWASVCPHLLASRWPHPRSPVPDRPDAISLPHQRWQLDFKEQIPVPGYGRIDVLNIRDEASPVKIASRVFPARQTRGTDVQETLRAAFTQWGLCDRLQTDRDKRLYNPNHDYPFPTVVVLWLAGLGIAHDLAPSAQANGCVERYHRTWYERVIRGNQFASLAEIQAVSDREVAHLNAHLPCHGRACDGQPPLVAYPSARQPRRPYRRTQEGQRFSLQRVYDYLAGGHWWRRVSKVGQVSLGGRRYQVSIDYAGQDVRVTCDGQHRHFPVYSSHDDLITTLELSTLTQAHITGLPP